MNFPLPPGMSCDYLGPSLTCIFAALAVWMGFGGMAVGMTVASPGLITIAAIVYGAGSKGMALASFVTIMRAIEQAPLAAVICGVFMTLDAFSGKFWDLLWQCCGGGGGMSVVTFFHFSGALIGGLGLIAGAAYWLIWEREYNRGVKAVVVGSVLCWHEEER